MPPNFPTVPTCYLLLEVRRRFGHVGEEKELHQTANVWPFSAEHSFIWQLRTCRCCEQGHLNGAGFCRSMGQPRTLLRGLATFTQLHPTLTNCYEMQKKSKVIYSQWGLQHWLACTSLCSSWGLTMHARKNLISFPLQREVYRKRLPCKSYLDIKTKLCVFLCRDFSHPLAMCIYPFTFCYTHSVFSDVLFHSIPFSLPRLILSVSPLHKLHLMFEFKSNFWTHDVKLVWN